MENVFERTGLQHGEKEISHRLYNLIIGLTLFWGFAVNWYMVTAIPVESIQGINPWVFIGGYFVSCFAGVMLFSASSNPFVSFLGYNLVVVPFGFIINLVVAQYSPDLVRSALEITAAITLIMMCLGTMFPKFFQSIGRGLFIALLAAIVVELIMIFVFQQKLAIMDFIVALIFCGYIGYDWSRANMIPKTVDNAVDSAAALYMDIINLFLRILSILGNSD